MSELKNSDCLKVRLQKEVSMMASQSFELIKEDRIAEINTQAKLYRHKKTGAEFLSLENDDENKVFGITFRTPPTDSTGLPHIMEHAVLCGSKKYPLKEPFVELLKGSLQTFLNAMTFSDKTAYPVASTNQKDFYNLVDVYLDAVFHPLIPEETLQQEGWHYELESLEDPLIFKGVVFNEMKGAYSSPDALLGRYSQQSLFPDNTYGVDSGGDPQVIPDLTYQQFKSFHETYYHPSNARIYFYGDDPVEERFAILESYLSAFEMQEVDSDVPLQPLWDAPKRFTYPFDASDDAAEANKYRFTLNWLLPEIRDAETIFSLQILSYILTGTAASPLRKALIDSGLGEDLIGGGMHSQMRQMYYSSGLTGVAEENIAKAETLILDTLAHLAANSIAKETIEAAMNTVEFHLRENNTGSFPRGLSLMFDALASWLYERDPVETLRYEKPLQALKDRLAAGDSVFENLITTYLLENVHRTTVILEPDPALRQKQEAAEAARLAKIREALDETELQTIIDHSQHLKALQEKPDSPEALATLPVLTLNDLDKENKLIPINVSEDNGSKILYHDLFTNSILYLQVGFDMHALPQELLPYATLFSMMLLDVGTESEDFVQLTQRIGRKTGGIGTSSFSSSVRNSAQGVAWFFLRGKCTMSQVDDMLEIMRDVLLTVKLDNPERFRQLILEEKAGHESGLIPGGHQVVNTRLRAKFNEIGWAREQRSGLDFLFFIRDLVERMDRDWPLILEKIEQVRTILLNRNTMLCNITLDQANWQQVQPKISAFIDSMPAKSPQIIQWMPNLNTRFEGLTIPTQVNYVGKGANLYDFGYELHGSIGVITNFLRTSWLWEKVRVQGGAYGGFCSFDQDSGVYTYLSYRDPNLLGTLDNYDLTANFLRELDLSKSELIKSIIGSIGSLDAYRLPDAKGYSSMVRYLVGITDEERQKTRDEILSTTAANFRAFADVLKSVNENGTVVVLGSQEAIAEANTQKGADWLKVMKVL